MIDTKYYNTYMNQEKLILTSFMIIFFNIVSLLFKRDVYGGILIALFLLPIMYAYEKRLEMKK